MLKAKPLNSGLYEFQYYGTSRRFRFVNVITLHLFNPLLHSATRHPLPQFVGVSRSFGNSRQFPALHEIINIVRGFVQLSTFRSA